MLPNKSNDLFIEPTEFMFQNNRGVPRQSFLVTATICNLFAPAG